MEAQTRAADRAFACSGCGRAYPEEGLAFRCPECGGTYDFVHPLTYRPASREGEPSRGIGRYRASFPLPDDAQFISLGEGGTPLARAEVEGRSIYFKSEHLNPTGSFKDRGTAVLVSVLRSQGVEAAVEDSSGNAGASFAAYAARAGMRAQIFVPDYASGPKRKQIEVYGANIVRIMGPRSNATEAALRAVGDGAVYASHAYLPHGLAGMATVAFELYEQLGTAPGAVIVPVGQGTLFLGLRRGFAALKSAGHIDSLPRLIAVQAIACAPIWAVQQGGTTGLLWTKEQDTVAEGIRIVHPLRGDEVLQALESTKGWAVAVDDAEIIAGRRELARRGFYVEPTSAVVWPGLKRVLEKVPDPVVVVLTGAGFKDPRDASE